MTRTGTTTRRAAFVHDHKFTDSLQDKKKETDKKGEKMGSAHGPNFANSKREFLTNQTITRLKRLLAVYEDFSFFGFYSVPINSTCSVSGGSLLSLLCIYY